MLQAELKNKLCNPQMYYSEDLLTSNVFGILKYLDSKTILIDFLRSTVNLENKTIPNISNISEWKFHFWPRFKNQVEPDLLLQGFHNNKLIVSILIEAKYRSGKNIYHKDPNKKSSYELTGDQLADQFNSLIEGQWLTEGIDTSPTPNNYIIYLTNNYTLPKDDILESLENIDHKYKTKSPIYWTSWRNLPGIFHRHLKEYSKGQQAMLTDLLALLEKKHINRNSFTYITTPTHIIKNKIIFFQPYTPKTTFNWEVKAIHLEPFFQRRNGNG